MKTTKILYWVFNGLFAFVMFGSGVPDLLSQADAVKGIHDNLGYPLYFVPFIGLAKMLGAIVILIPAFPRLKEWAYAGLTFNLIFAFISHACVDKNIGFMLLPLVILGILAISYLYKNKTPNI